MCVPTFTELTVGYEAHARADAHTVTKRETSTQVSHAYIAASKNVQFSTAKVSFSIMN